MAGSYMTKERNMRRKPTLIGARDTAITGQVTGRSRYSLQPYGRNGEGRKDCRYQNLI